MRKFINSNGLFIFLALVSILGLIVAASFIPTKEWPILNSVLTSICSATIAGLILAITIEKVSAEQREEQTEVAIKSIKKNLFKAIYQRSIPESIFNEVEECLLKTNVVRKKYTIDYVIKPINDTNLTDDEIGSHFLCSVSSSYELKNITGRAVKANVHFGLEASVDQKFSKHTKILSFECNGEKHKYENKDEDHQVSIGTDVLLKPHESIRVTMQGQLVKRNIDLEMWSSLVPSDGVSLRVNCTVPDLKVEAKVNNSHALEEIMADEEAGTYHWELNNGLFPHQSIVFWWTMSE